MNNLANKITILRFMLSPFCFILLLKVSYHLDNLSQTKITDLDITPNIKYTIIITVAVYIFAILTDILDGYIARRYSKTTQFGRVWDPLIDKILIVGSLVILTATKNLQFILPTWMVVVIVAREFLIQGVRNFVEAKGIKFGADIFGKQKMAWQGITIIAILCYIGFFSKLALALPLLRVIVWLMFISTVVSGIIYIIKSYRYLFSK